MKGMKKLKWMTFIVGIMLMTGCKAQRKVSSDEYSDQIKEVQEIAIDSENKNIEIEKSDLRVPISYVKSKNPYLVKDKSLVYFNRLIFESLCEYNSNFELKNQLAQSITRSEDGKIIRVKIKQGVKWHDGSELNANDIVFSYNLLKNQYQNSNYKGLFESIFDFSGNLNSKIRVRKISSHEVELIFDKNYINAEYLLTIPIVNRKTTLSGLGDNTNSYRKIMNNDYEFKVNGTGPYRFDEYKPLKEYSLQSFSEYRNGKSNIESVKGIIVSTEDAFLTSVLAGITDLTVTNELDWGKYVENKKLELYDYAGTSLDLIFYNHNRKIFKDDIGRNIRLAIANVIDRDSIIKKAFLRHGESTHTLRHPKIKADGQSFLYDQYDLSNFAQILEDNGYAKNEYGYYSKSNKAIELEAIALRDDIRVKQLEIIKENLREIGVSVRFKFYDNMEEFQKALLNKKFDIAVATLNMPINDFYDEIIKTNGSLNFGGYSNVDIDNTLRDLKTLSGNELEEKKEELLRAIGQQQIVTPIAYRDRAILIDDRIKGNINPSVFDIYDNITSWTIRSGEEED